jgi:hypothetical protein
VTTLRVAQRRQPALPPRSAGRRAPLLVLVGACALLAAGAGWIAAHVSTFVLDETLMEQSAVHYTSNLPHSLFHDLDARATSRLYPLVLSVAFRLLSGAQAVRVDHVLSVLLFVSAAVPIYLVGRVILDSRWAACAAALLSVSAPWLTLSSALYTENLSFALFWWMMLATCSALWRPSLGRDALALLSIALLISTRVQFAAVFVGYLLSLLALGGWRVARAADSAGQRARHALHIARRHTLSLALLAGALGAYVYEHAAGRWHGDVERLLGAYSNVVIRTALPSNMAEGALVELLALALGVGLLPAIVSIAWYVRQISRPRLDRRWTYIACCGAIAAVFVLLTVYSQNGYIGPLTEERYFFYVAPVFWLGALAALGDWRSVGWRAIAACSLAFAALYGAIPFLSSLSAETAFLRPVEAVVPHVLAQRFAQLRLSGLTVQDALALLALAAGGLTALLWRRRPALRLGWTVGAAAAAQLLLTGYAFAVIDGKVQGIPGRTGGSLAALGWVDKHARGAPVVWLEDMPAGEIAVYEQRTTLFWNSRLLSWATVPQLGLAPVDWPLAALPGAPLSFSTSDGALQPPAQAASMQRVLFASSSPFLQLAGTTLARSPDGALSLVAPAQPVRASWAALGLQPDGYVAAGSPARLFAFAPKSATVQALTARLTFGALPAGAAASAVYVRLGPSARRVRLLPGAAPRTVALSLCFPAGRTAVGGQLRAARASAVAGRALAGQLLAVSLAPAPRGRTARCA